jgi:hypothetical protein
LELRKQLISKDREEGEISRRFFQQELADAARGREMARAAHKNWWISAGVSGVIMIALAFYFGGPVGALCGLLVGYFNGCRLERHASRKREMAVADAQRELMEAEERWDTVRNEPQTFSQREARTGQPDAEKQIRSA